MRLIKVGGSAAKPISSTSMPKLDVLCEKPQAAMKGMPEFLALFCESDRAKCRRHVAEIIGDDPSFGAPSLSEIGKILSLIPKEERRYALEVGILRLYKHKTEMTPGVLSKISGILELLPEYYRKDALYTDIDRIFEAQPWIDEKTIGHVLDAASSIPQKYRAYFLECHVTEIFEALPPAKLEGAEAAMKKSVRSINAGRFVLPEETLMGRNIDYEESCPQSKDYFKCGITDGTLVEARLPMPGFEMRVLIKGLILGTDRGNVLAYEPDSNTIWSIQISNGVFVGAKQEFKLRGSDLQERVYEKLGWND
ncbi:MAG: hypothetical protein NTV88_00725 [Candidatus Micrarchaeota archaeon]|nr:hypothetical protein [Candidatus Micrarchaeota archaeon]